MTNEVIEIKPQSGTQERALACSADILIFGGAAGGGKSYNSLLEPLRSIEVPGFSSITFRRTRPMIRKAGGLWDESFKIYPHIGGTPREQALEWIFRHRNRIIFDQLEYENTIYDHHSAQYPLIQFDELTQFTKKQFYYMLSRSRSLCGVKPYIRAGTNPTPITDPVGGWVRELIDWWIKEDGFADESKSRVLRYFTRGEDDKILWVDRDWRSPEGDAPKSFTFIPSYLTDNKILIDKDPGYRQNLLSLSRVDRMRLLSGNWNVDENEGLFESHWFHIIDQNELPRLQQLFRYWDRAATEEQAGTDPDWTAGALGGIDAKGDLYILDVVHFRGTPATNEKRIKQTAVIDGRETIIGIEQEPGSSGVDVIHHYQTDVLKGFVVKSDRPSGNKIVRAKPWAALAEFKRVHLVRGLWNRAFIAEAEQFPKGKRDQIDAVSGVYTLCGKKDSIIGANIAI